MQKDNSFKADDYRKIANESHTKINTNLNLENLQEMVKAVKEDSLENTNLSLQDMEVTKSNFINKFKNF